MQPSIFNIWYMSSRAGARNVERISGEELERVYALYQALKTLNANSISGVSPTDKEFHIRIDRDLRS